MENKGEIMFIFAYLLTWLSGIIVYVLYADKDKDLRFHSIQAILLGIVIFIIEGISFFIFFTARIIVNIVILLLWLYGLYVGYKAYEGVSIKMPVIGDMIK
ncbi:MAG: hypothetical protein ACYDAO_00165 [Thermoplasmataceae archaeon]